MRPINIFSLSLIILATFIISGCFPSPKPNEHIAPEVHIKYDDNKTYVQGRIVYFEPDSFELTPKAKALLTTFSEELVKDKDVTLKIRAHTSEVGNENYNLVLSKSRLTSIMDFLYEHNVTKGTVVKTESLGKREPLCFEETKECNALNRRVEIVTVYGTTDEEYHVIDGDVKIMRMAKSDAQIKEELLRLQQKRTSAYTIGSGDRFDVYVYGEPELTIKHGIIKPDGTLTIAMIGDVKISGLTINEAMRKISGQLKRYMVEPIVTIVPSEFRSKNYTILGKVLKPGNYPVEENTRVLDTIADASGLSIGIFKDNTIELADLEHAYLRRGTRVLPVNFVELVRKGNPLHNIPLQDKDYIYIPSALNTEVYILGEVELPGYFGFKEMMTLSQLVSYSEGFKETANINEVAIIRGRLSDPSVFVVDLEAIIEGEALDFRLKPYDMVFVPKTKLGDWNTLMRMLTPSINALTSAFIVKQLVTP